MEIRINGEKATLDRGEALPALLARLGFDALRVAVLLNGGIVPRDALADAVLKPGDELDVVAFVGGG